MYITGEFMEEKSPSGCAGCRETADMTEFVSLLSRLALSFDGAVLGAALAYGAVRTVFKLTASCSALINLREVGELVEDKMLASGKNISVVGICSFRNGVPEIESCKDFPHFLCEMSKDHQMILDLVFKTKFLFWSTIVLGSLSVGILGYSLVRNWNRWKQWRHQRQLDNSLIVLPLDSFNGYLNHPDYENELEDEVESDADDNPSNVPDDDDALSNSRDGELCVVCLMSIKQYAFIPCGHFVCCERCAISVKHDPDPKCPICRQRVRTSLRIYDS